MSNFIAGPLTRAEIDRMTSTQLRWHELNNKESLEAALNPPAPVPETSQQKWQKEMEALFVEFEEWAKKNNPNLIANWSKLSFDQKTIDFGFRIFQQDHEEFVAHQISDKEVDRWIADHPEYIVAESNRKLLLGWLKAHSLPATYWALQEAYAALKNDLALDKTKMSDPNRPETRPGRFRNGVFEPMFPDVEAPATAYAQHSQPHVKVGQPDPSRVAGGEPVIRKHVGNMSADEYLRNLNASRSFQKKMDESR